MDKVKAGVSNLSDDELVDLIVGHKAALVGNANFTTPSPSVADYATATDPYLTADAQIKNCQMQLDAAFMARQHARPNAERATSLRAAYVQTASGGKGELIVTSHFEVQGKPGPKGAPTQPTSFAATMGDMPGNVDTMWDRQRGRSFIIQYTETPTDQASWKQAGVSTTSSFTVKGLVSGKKYFFRVCPVLGDEMGPWSDEASCMAP